MEFPRPTYPGDFVSTNIYESGQFGITYVELSPDNPGPFRLELPHDGLVTDMLYEVVFGPLVYTISASSPVDAEFGMSIYHGSGPSVQLFTQNFTGFEIRTIVPVVQCYMVPSLTEPGPVVPANSFFVDFSMAGNPGTFVTLEYAFPTIFAVRPCDQTNNDSFRIISAEGVDLPYIGGE